jgi:dihydropteroate synthase
MKTETPPRVWYCGSIALVLDRPRVMGIVNVTPDSFSDGGQFDHHDVAVRHALQLVDEGADIIDIGGESTRPGATPVAMKTEIDRVVPVLKTLVSELEGRGIALSVDTRHAAVMEAALEVGAHIINDVSALRDANAIDVVANSSAGVCLMHMQLDPTRMQQAPTYVDPVAEVSGFLQERIDACHAGGIGVDRIVVDPGFGFGKTFEHNVALFQAIPAFAGLGVGVLVGLSRKAMIGQITGRPIAERMVGSVAAALMAADLGASILRAHNVRETVDALRVWSALRSDQATIH